MAEFADVVHGFRHPTLSQHPLYGELRRVLAEIVDTSPAPLARMLSDIRDCTLSAPLGALCGDCNRTVWPWGLRRENDALRGVYRCECGRIFGHTTSLEDVDWR